MGNCPNSSENETSEKGTGLILDKKKRQIGIRGEILISQNLPEKIAENVATVLLDAKTYFDDIHKICSVEVIDKTSGVHSSITNLKIKDVQDLLSVVSTKIKALLDSHAKRDE